MDDLHKHTQAHMRLKAGGGSIIAPADGEEGVGEVGRCGHWDAEYDTHGYCRDRECRHTRLVRALQNGDAFRTPDGTLVWYVK